MHDDHPATEPIAIIGMAGIFPGAPDLRTFWNNILNGVDAIGEPTEAWGASRYLGDGRIKTQYGGFLRDLYRFDAREFGIMPNSIDGSEPDQFLALRVARDALMDAGYASTTADHTSTGIVLGHSTYLHRGQGTLIQQNIVLDQTMDVLKAALPHLDGQVLDQVRAILKRKLPPTNADTVPGLVPNVMTGRIANRLNLRGPNYLLDAACSSSLLAVGAAIDELRARRSDMMLAGGVNATLPAEVTTIFTQLGALTTRGKVRPFSVGSDGTLLGEGLGVVVLKRLDDALAAGDRIYALIRGVGQSSDGRGSGLLAPSHEGETLAIRRTYEANGIDPSTVELFEAHGTGIPLGDQTEIASLKAVFGERQTPGGVIALGSVKSMISHCIPAAGIAGLIKMALSVHHKVLPPMLCEQVNPDLGIEQTPFYINTRAAPWIARLDVRRRAAVNAFGFGGTNSHAIIEEAPASAHTPRRLQSLPQELAVLSAPSAEALAERLDTLGAAIGQHPEWQLAQIAAALGAADQGAEHRLAIVAKDVAALQKQLTQASARLRDPKARWPTRGGVFYSSRRTSGKLAFLFPGEGSQYQGMLAELAMHFEPVRRWLDFWRGLHDLPRGQARTDVVYPTAEADEARRADLERQLYGMDVGSEAVYLGGLAVYTLLRALGVEPDCMLGHSSGESAALSASGANPAASLAEQAHCIQRHNTIYQALLTSGKIPSGALLAVGALDGAVVEAQAAAARDVLIAMDNCSNQRVLYGPPDSIGGLAQALSKLGAVCLPLPFDRGYHTPAFEDARVAFYEYYKEIGIGAPKIPLYSCSSVGLFPAQDEAARELAAAQWSTRVRFRETIERMHADGVEYFIEVGPSGNLTAFVNDILKGRSFVALSSNVRGRGDVEQLLAVLGQLYVVGRLPSTAPLFETRSIDAIDLAAPPPTRRMPVIDNTMPMVRLGGDDVETIGALIAATLPAMGSASAAVALESPAHAPTPETPAASGGLPLLETVLEHDDQHVRARSNASLARDNYVRHHVMTGPVSETDPTLHGLSCVPMSVSLELMAEACALLAGRTDVRVIEHLHAYDWVALDEDEVTVEVLAELVDRDAGRYRASVLTTRGAALSAEFVFNPDWRLPGIAPLSAPRASCWNAPDLYTTGMFHGPVLQSLRYIDGWDDTGVDVQLSDCSLADFIEDGQTPSLVLNPVLLDALGQVVACWLVQFFGTEFNNFPSTIGRIELYETCPVTHTGLAMRARQRPIDGESSFPGDPRTWDVECVDGNGQPLLRVQDFVNVFWQMPPAYHQVRWRPLLGWLGRPLSPTGDNSILLWEVPLLASDFLLQSGAICLRTLAHALLSHDERTQWQSLAGPPRRRIEWLFGRAAIKEAVRHWIYQQTGELLYPTDVIVRTTDEGAPFVEGWWCGRLIDAPSVSLSHNPQVCVAAVTDGDDGAVGVDIEDAARARPDLLEKTLSPAELALLADQSGAARQSRIIHFMSAKEAASKCLGIGLQGNPEAYEVVSIDRGCEKILVQHALGRANVKLLRCGSAPIAIAVLESAEAGALQY